MSSNYLEKFRSALPTTQGKQILKLLISKRDKGEITTVNEFKKKLTELTSQLLAERITPTLKLYEAIPGEDISSIQFNDMLERIEDDLNAAFAEADNLDQIIAAHHNVINNVSLKALRFAINELESKVSLYEFINKNKQGFDSAQFNTFRESQNLSTSRSDQAASLVYIDPRIPVTLEKFKNSFIDIVGERLILGPEEISYINLHSANWLSNANSIRSELNVEFPNSRISNIIDNTNNTYWVVPILLSNIRHTGVPMEINLRLSAIQDVNFVEIEPATDFPMILTKIDYMNSNNERKPILESNVKLIGPTRINFKRITGSSIILQFRQDNYKEIQFKTKPGESNFHKAVLGESNLPIDLESASEDLKAMLSSDFILSDIMGVSNISGTNKKYFQYILGFDNIKVGFNTFSERSIFVSKKVNTKNLGQVGLKTLEIRPTEVQDSGTITFQEYNYPARSIDEDNKFYHGSIEYWLIAQSFSKDNFLVSTDVLPILPINAQRVYHERVIFSKKSTNANNDDLATLRFYTDNNESDVIVYRNGTKLTYGTVAETADWEFVGDGTTGNDENINDTDLTQTQPGFGSRMKRGIHIHAEVKDLDIYTISYTPVTSNTRSLQSDNSGLLKIIDLVGDKTIRLVPENIIIFDSFRKSHSIARIEIYLNIIMRRNSANINFSPAVEEYMLVTGSRDQNKFVGD